jgi:uncharacterized protein YjbJ (UPF0337 family)
MTNRNQGASRNTIAGSSPTGQGVNQDPLRETADQAKDAVGQVAGQAKGAVGQVTGQAREQVTTRLSGQKDRAAQGLGSVAHALRITGQQLREQDQVGGTVYLDRVASEVERFSTYLEQSDVGQMVGDAERFARRQPALFLGGAFVLGLLGARFLKSSASQSQQANQYPLAQRTDVATAADYSQGYARGSGAAATYTTPITTDLGSRAEDL